jgi:hypothetical protein
MSYKAIQWLTGNVGLLSASERSLSLRSSISPMASALALATVRADLSGPAIRARRVGRNMQCCALESACRHSDFARSYRSAGESRRGLLRPSVSMEHTGPRCTEQVATSGLSAVFHFAGLWLKPARRVCPASTGMVTPVTAAANSELR